MSLLNYTVFINSLLVDLKKSKACSMIFKTPSIPVGYADDLAAACNCKLKMDRVMEIVSWRSCIPTGVLGGTILTLGKVEFWFLAK